MKHTLTFFLLVTSLLGSSLLLHSCTKTPDEPPAQPQPKPCTSCLPPITTEGKGTFGCKVNGKIWLPKGAWGYPATGLSYSNATLSIYGYNDIKKERIGYSLTQITDTGLYDLSTNPFSFSSAGFSNILSQESKYNSEPITKGEIHILRFEPSTSGIISGTFAFDLYNANQDTMHITEGRFDLHF